MCFIYNAVGILNWSQSNYLSIQWTKSRNKIKSRSRWDGVSNVVDAEKIYENFQMYALICSGDARVVFKDQ